MEIGIHAAALSRPRLAGVERYTRELLAAMLALPEAAQHRFTLFSPAPVQDFALPPHAQVRTLTAPVAFTQLALSSAFLRKKPEVFFSPAHALPRIIPRRTVVTVHGLEYERVPWAYPLRQRLWLHMVTKDAVSRAQKVIAVSEATKQDLIERYRVPEEKIAVISHGIALVGQRGKKQQAAPRPYFLYLGRLESKKNVEGIVRAFTTFKTITKLPHKLFLAGAAGFGAKAIFALIKKSPARDDIVWFGYVPDEAREVLLERAEAFLFPSWAEGFGLPILEAQAQGIPVITSNNTAMPEVAGHAALFVDPDDSEMLAQAMRKIIEDEKLRQNLIAAGLANVKRFSWEKTAHKTLAVLTQ